MNKEKAKQEKHARRQGRIRAKVNGTKERPRLSVFRSNTGMYLQLINDDSGKTIASADMREIKKSKEGGSPRSPRLRLGEAGASSGGAGKISVSFELGKLLAQKAVAAGIKKVVFDRGGYKYHGRIKAAADGAREGGLEF